MAQRLATEYVKTCLELTEAEMDQFIRLFRDHETRLQVKVLDNGSQELVFQDEAPQDIVLSFQRNAGIYVCTASCRLKSPRLAGAMRKAVSVFKGDALVKRIYNGFTMVYEYQRGAVVKIAEVKNGVQNVIYEFKDTVGELERLFKRREVEMEINRIHSEIDCLLDLRNAAVRPELQAGIDRDLSALTNRLFVLEG